MVLCEHPPTPHPPFQISFIVLTNEVLTCEMKLLLFQSGKKITKYMWNNPR